ncbi:MAG: ATP-binding cassette domain-containing protein [Pyrobaculum sp.]
MALQIERLHARRGNFSLYVERLEVNSIVAVLGRNGSGKTTLLDAVAGVIKATGRVAACGRDVSTLPQERRGLAYIQATPVEPPGRVEKFLRDVAKLHGAEREVEEVAKSLGVWDLLPRGGGRLSTGQRQLVNLAAALLAKPCAFLMDEPTSHLDWINKRRFMDLVRGLDRPVLYVTHDPFEAMYISDHICVMEGGQLKRCTPNREGGILEAYMLAERLLS